MILIADSGATKTDWWWGDTNTQGTTVQTEGINPFHQQQEAICQILSESLLPQLTSPEICTALFFYGAGCTPEKSIELKDILQPFFPNAHIEVTGDLLGAARALCGRQPGIACILGTGSNSCYYDGNKILANTPPLGYILGDEGSGATLGKRFIADGLKGLLPKDLFNEFLASQNHTLSSLLERIYRQPLANRFLARITPFIYKYRHEETIHQLLVECFSDFITRNLHAYPLDLPVSFTGSVSWYFKEEVEQALQLHQRQAGRFVQKPLDELVKFHLHP